MIAAGALLLAFLLSFYPFVERVYDDWYFHLSPRDRAALKTLRDRLAREVDQRILSRFKQQ